MTTALIALGANIPPAHGEIKQTFERVLGALGAVEGLGPATRSRWYRTPAFPPGSGPDFLNGAVMAATTLAPGALLAALHGIEAALGRERHARWAPRVCDIDLIAVGDKVLPDAKTQAEWMALDRGHAQTLVPPRLILPHPRMQERGFVLVPLADLAPDWRHPATGRSVTQMLAALPAEDLAAIRPLAD